MSSRLELDQALKQYFGHGEFRPQQREAIEHLVGGGDALVLMPTGGGKSLCYQLPGVLTQGLTVVVSPLIALMYDQVTQLREVGIEAAYMNSTLSPNELAATEQRAANGMIQLLYVAPERVNTNRFRNLMQHRQPSLIAIDEAHCISEWGHEFRPDYLELHTLTERFVDVPVVALTATATPQVQRQIIERLDRPQMRRFATGFMRDNLTYRIVPKRDSTERLIQRLKRRPGEAAIVYCGTRNMSESTASRLQAAGIRADHYHAGMTPKQRAKVQGGFQSGEITVVCATIAFGMGIDKPDIRLVAHLDMPPSMESFYQETGRAGRDGLPAECILFYTPGIWQQQRRFIDQLTDPDERERRVKRLRQMMDMCEQRTCRWGTVLRYFGEERPAERCGHCDNCLGEAESQPKVVETDQSAPSSPILKSNETLLTSDQTTLYEQLRQERTRIAAEHALPAYVVCSNRTLDDLVRSLPTTPEAMLNVSGFGRKRVERYADHFLPLIRDHLHTHPQQSEFGVSSETAAVSVATADRSGEMTMLATQPPATLSADRSDASTSESSADWVQRFNDLAAWRDAAAAKTERDGSSIISFPAMREIAQNPPTDWETLAAQIAMDAEDLEERRDELLDLLGIPNVAKTAEPSEPVAEVTDVTDVAVVPAVTQPKSWMTSLALFESGHTPLAIAERRMLSPGTVAGHLVTAVKADPELDLSPALPSAEYVAQVQALLRQEPEAPLSQLHEQIDYRLSAGELKLVVAYLRPD